MAAGVSRFDAPASDTSRLRLAANAEMFAAAHLLFPAAILTIAVVGFALGQGIGPWVLPVAVGVTIVAVRAFGGSWWIVTLAALAHGVAGLLAVALPDDSWDGLRYHQEAILRLAAGWNPLFEDAAKYGPGARETLFINHYPRLGSTPGAALLSSTGYIEAGKLFNLTLMLAAAAQAMSALLRLTAVPVTVAVGVGALVALNPVAICQAPTFYVDGMLASLLTVVVAGLTTYVMRPSGRVLAVVMLAVCLLINVKFSGLLYSGALLALVVPVVWWRHGLPAAGRIGASALAACAVAVMVLGHAPYVRNLREHGDLFHPVRAAPELIGLGVEGAFRPVNLNAGNRVTRFLVSSLSRTEPVRPPGATRVKLPLWIGRDELRGTYGADIEAGGFGPLYGASLGLAALAVVALLADPRSRAAGGAALLVAGCVAGSIFVHSETWWARYVPQGWLLPLLIAVPALTSPWRSLRWYLGCAVALLAAATVLIVGANVALNHVAYASATRAALREMGAAPQPVTVYLDRFRSLRQRLREAGVAFTIVDTPPEPASRRHRFPAPGAVFWHDRSH